MGRVGGGNEVGMVGRVRGGLVMEVVDVGGSDGIFGLENEGLVILDVGIRMVVSLVRMEEEEG